jgi:hypothetical protein
MDRVAMIVGTSWILAALVCAGLSIPLILGKIRRNRLYGARFRQSFASDESWFAINRFAGRQFLIWSAPLSASGIVALFLPLEAHPALAIAIAFAPLIFIFIPAIATWRFAQRFENRG